MKKTLLALLLTSASTIGLAATTTTPFDGFYVGAGIGGSNSSFNFDQTVMLSPIDTTTGIAIFNITIPHNANLTDSSFAGNIDLGFGHVFNQFIYLGLEAEDTLQNLSATDKMGVGESNSQLSINSNTTSSLNNEFALTLNPGIVIHQTTLLYGKVGAAWGNFETTSMTSYNQEIFSPAMLNSSTNYDQGSNTEVGLRLGIGLEHYLSQHCSLRLEYDHTQYNRIADINEAGPVTVSPAIIPIGGTIMNSETVDASDNSIMLNFNYHFG